jgi:hypothetical protein
LLDENATSVNYRYSENNTYTYQYEHPQHTGWTAPSAPRRPFPPGYTYASSAFQATVPSA